MGSGTEVRAMEITKVNLCGVISGGPGWEAARAAVTASMVAHGCVIVVAPDMLSADQRRALFSRALPELFELPLEVKQRTTSTKGDYRGYIGHNQFPGVEWEGLLVGEPTDVASVQGFTETLWPKGNPEFCEIIVSFAKSMLKLEEMVETLVLEGLGVRQESIDTHFDLLGHGLRLSHYSVPSDTKNSVSMGAHRDDTLVTTIVQHEVEGLEVLTKDGRWVAVPPEPGTFTFVAGEFFRVLTNGRVPASLHRVRTPSNCERFSVLFSSTPKDGVALHALEDLVDTEHPLVYNPLKHEEYSKWKHSEAARKFEDPLEAYCGVEKVGATT